MIDQLTDRLVSQAKTAALKGAVFAAIGLVLVIGLGFLLAALYLAIAASYGAIVAALTLGGSMVTLALIALAIMLQRDPGEGVAKPRDQAANAAPGRAEDDVLFDLLVHSALAGYATGQGNRPKMQAGFDQMIDDLNVLGVFDPTGRAPKAPPPSENADTKMAG